MSPRKSLARLAGSVALLVAIAALAVMATTSAFAFNTATDQQSTAGNGGPTNDAGAVSNLTLNVASAETVVASYSFASTQISAAAGSTGGGTSIRVMYQQWRQETQNDWFYLYAVNSNATASAAATPFFDYYYYTPMRGATRVAASVANNAGTVASPAGLGTTSFIYLTTGTAVPAFGIELLNANVPNCAGPIATRCGATFTATLRWGVAQQGFRDESNTGTFAVLQAVESYAIPTSLTTQNLVYYDAFEPIFQTTDSRVTLNDIAPTQSATGVTNASGSRQSGTATAYDSTQTVADADGDLSSQSLIWVFSSGTMAGQWFQAGAYYQRTTGGYSLNGAYTVFYQSWNEAVTYTTAGSQLTTNYFTSLRISPTVAGATTVTTRDVGAGELGITSSSLVYSYIYSSAARGSFNIWGRAEDWHGRTSGNVLVGTQTVS